MIERSIFEMNKPRKAILYSAFAMTLFLFSTKRVQAEEIPELSQETEEAVSFEEEEPDQEQEEIFEPEEEQEEETPEEEVLPEPAEIEPAVQTPEEPAVLSGFQQIGDAWFYYDPDSGEVLKGEQYIDGSWYDFDPEDGHMLTGWQEIDALHKTVYYSTETGELSEEEEEEETPVQSGLVTENGVTYFIDETTGEKLGGQVYDNGSWYYFDEETKEMVTGFHYSPEEKKTVYYGDNGAMRTGERTIESDVYYFDEDTGAMATGLTEIPSLEKTSYFDEQGRMQYGQQTLDGADYYFNETDGSMVTGFKYLNDKKITVYYSQYGRKQHGEVKVSGYYYWLDEITGARYSGFKYFSASDLLRYYGSDGKMKTNTFTYEGKTYNVRSNGDIINRYVYSTPYYAQGDARWASIRFGSWNMASAGCVPSSVAMAISAVTGTAVTPDAVASWLYNNTMDYNKTEIGGSGLCAPKAASAWGISTTAIGSLSNLRSQLTLGKVVTAAMNPGTFSPAGFTHMIVLTKISGNQVYVQDPLNSGRNGWYNIDLVWNQRSTDPTDNRGGYVFYAFYQRWY